MLITLRLSVLSRVVPPIPTLFRGGVFGLGLSSSCRRRFSCRHVAGRVRSLATAARRLAAVARATDPLSRRPRFL